MLRKTLIITGLALMTGACSTISEESCIAGSWESLGYEDGRKGESRSHFNKIAETCAKYGITANAVDYRLGYDQGLPLYCSYDKGLKHGEVGDSVKTECLEINASPYLDGYDEGRVIFEIRREYDALIDVYTDKRESLEDVAYRLTEDGLSDKERKKLRKKQRRLEDELDDARIDIRAFERIQNWPKQDLPAPDYKSSD